MKKIINYFFQYKSYLDKFQKPLNFSDKDSWGGMINFMTDRMVKLEKAFKNIRNFYSSDFGNFYCWTINAKNCFQIIKKKIKKKNNYLIK